MQPDCFTDVQVAESRVAISGNNHDVRSHINAQSHPMQMTCKMCDHIFNDVM